MQRFHTCLWGKQQLQKQTRIVSLFLQNRFLWRWINLRRLKRNNQLTFFIGSTTTSYDQFENQLRCLIFPQARPLTILELKHVTIPELLLGPFKWSWGTPCKRCNPLSHIRLHTILQPRDSGVKFLEVVSAIANVT